LKKIYYILLVFLLSCTPITDSTSSDLYQIEIYPRLESINNYYYLPISTESHQTIHRISGRILRNGKEPYPPEKVLWESSHFWWLLEGDIVASITRLYFNPFTGQYQYVNLPPIINPKDILVPTINSHSYSGRGGEINTIIAPIREMVGDTLRIHVKHSDITKTIFIILTPSGI
jgi:hypothetical protein